MKKQIICLMLAIITVLGPMIMPVAAEEGPVQSETQKRDILWPVINLAVTCGVLVIVIRKIKKNQGDS